MVEKQKFKLQKNKNKIKIKNPYQLLDGYCNIVYFLCLVWCATDASLVKESTVCLSWLFISASYELFNSALHFSITPLIRRLNQKVVEVNYRGPVFLCYFSFKLCLSRCYQCYPLG